MSEKLPPSLATAGSVPPDPENPAPLERDGAADGGAGTTTAAPPAPPQRTLAALLGGSGATRNLGLVIVLAIIVLVGFLTAGQQFVSVNNAVTILRLAAVFGVVAVGMTFVITGGGIDLSVGSVLGLASVWATTLATQTLAADTHWIVMVFTALAVGTVAGLVNGVLIAYGKVVAFIATLAMLVAARGLAEIIAQRRTQVVTNREFLAFFGNDVLGIPVLVWIFVVVAVAGWFLLNRTTFGRRTIAVGGNPEAARLAGINVKRHTMYLYALSGFTAGIGGLMMLARTTAGSSTNGQLYELEAIAIVVVGGTLLAGGRGTIVGTVLGTLIFACLTNVFIQNNLSISVQSIAKGAIIVIAVLLQQRFATRRPSGARSP